MFLTGCVEGLTERAPVRTLEPQNNIGLLPQATIMPIFMLVLKIASFFDILQLSSTAEAEGEVTAV